MNEQNRDHSKKKAFPEAASKFFKGFFVTVLAMGICAGLFLLGQAAWKRISPLRETESSETDTVYLSAEETAARVSTYEEDPVGKAAETETAKETAAMTAAETPDAEESLPDLEPVYRAYLKVLRENRTAIEAAGPAFTGFAEPVAVCDILGDGAPELLFVSYDSGKYEGSFSVYTYADGWAQCVFSRNITRWENEYGTDTQFHCLYAGEDGLYEMRQGGADTILFSMERYPAGEDLAASKPQTVLSYLAAYRIRGNDGTYEYTYSAGKTPVPETEFRQRLKAESEKIKYIILYDGRLFSDLLTPFCEAQEKAPHLGMNCKDAISYLQSLAGDEENEPGAESDFSMIGGKEFYYGSGVGAWGTWLTIEKDGTFSGEYHNSEMGDTGEGYPNGTCYISRFHGRFSRPESFDDHTLSFRLEELTYDEPLQDYMEDGIRYLIDTANGVEGGKTFLLFLPGAPMKDLPGRFQEWSSMQQGWYSNNMPEQLPCFGIYNVETEDTFTCSE